ncbi:MAG TPA: hypothetical protein DEP72_02560 [Clostridiales bacterium]|nr:hypothetical protein [Clostridiales bacterium]
MKNKLNKGVTLILTCVIMISSFLAISYGLKGDVPIDLPIIADLSDMSGLESKDINKLYASVKDWDKISENIMIYKQILTLVDKNISIREKAFEYIGKYNANDLLSIYEFLNANKLVLEKADKILKNYDKTKEIDLYQSFDKYKPAGKEEIRNWLNDGLLPEEILTVDAIAMQKDMSIDKVIELKTDKNTWDDISKKLSFVADVPKDADVTLSIGKGQDARTFADKDFSKIADKVNLEAKANDDANNSIDGLADTDRDKLEKQGLNKQEMKNIARLAIDSGKTVDEILLYKNSAKDWKKVIEKYGKK